MNRTIGIYLSLLIVEAIRLAYQKTASTKYYFRLLRKNNCIPKSSTNEMLSECKAIKRIIEPVVEKYRGEYDDMDEDELNECQQMLRDSFPFLFSDDEDEE